ncbi:MAG: hypothetical protein Q7W51_08350 [Coriobacteriia bacterium]|nr:hypothetical protein [Coriobacteriia bacterium]
MLADLYEELPFVILLGRQLALEQAEWLQRVAYVICDDDFRILQVCDGSGTPTESMAEVHDQFFIGGNASKAHDEWVEERLMGFARSAIRRPPENTRYLPLHDGAWANMWIDVKTLLQESSFAFFAAYQIGYRLSRGYRDEFPEDAIVASNNTAYVLASLLQALFSHKQLVMIDRLGPLPDLTELWLLGLERIGAKRLCWIEDVMSTGRELDMTQLVVRQYNAEVTQAVCLFDLEVAKSRLMSPSKIESLCRPSKAIGYSRLAKYEIEPEELGVLK